MDMREKNCKQTRCRRKILTLFFGFSCLTPTLCFTETIHISPHQFVLNSEGQTEDLQAIFNMALPAGHNIAEHDVNLYFENTYIATATELSYCLVDQNLFVNFSREDIQNNPEIPTFVGRDVIATVNGWFDIEHDSKDPNRYEISGEGLMTILAANWDMVITKAETAPQGDDILLAFDTDDQNSQNLLLWDRGQGAETTYGQTFKFHQPIRLDKVTIKIKPREVDISGKPLELWLGWAHHHNTDSRITELIAIPKADLPQNLTFDTPWYITMDFEDVYLVAEADYGFMPRFASGGSGHGSGNSLEADLWAMGEYAYKDGAAFMYSGNWPGTLLNNELVFFLHGSVVTESPIKGDFNIDFLVNLHDYTRLAAQWLQYQCGECGEVDINKDQNVDYTDLYFFMQNWLKSLY